MLAHGWHLDSLADDYVIIRKFEKVDALITKLTKVRLNVDKLEQNDPFYFYSGFITQIIDIIENIEIAQSTSTQSRLTGDFINFLWLIERSGQERGALNSILTTDNMDMMHMQNVLTYIAAQNEIIERILATASEQQKQALEEFISSPIHTDVVTVRKDIQLKLERDSTLSQIKSLVGFNGINHHLKDYLYSGDIKHLDALRPKLAKLRQAVNQFEHRFTRNANDSSAIESLKFLISEFEQRIQGKQPLTEAQQQALSPNSHLFDNSQIVQAMEFLQQAQLDISHSHWWQLTTSRLESIRKINKTIASQMVANAAVLERRSIQALAINMITISITILISLLLSYLILQRLVGELGNMTRFMTRIKHQHHFDQQFTLTGNDEITEIERAYNELLQERKKAEHSTRISAAVFEHASEAILISNGDNIIEEVNPAFTAITGYTPEEVIGKTPSLLKSGRHDDSFYQTMWQSIESKGRWQGEIWNRRKNGEIFPEFIAISVVKDRDGNVLQHISLFSDITKHKQYEQDIWHQANYDALTQLPNRSLMLNRLTHEIDLMQRTDKSLAVMLIDLDRFKFVNDTYGHSYGDELLVIIANKLKRCLRKSDTIARLGGDEFVVLIPNIDDVVNVEQVARNILSVVSAPISLSNNQEAIVSASIGVTVYPQDADGAEALLKNADTAMYRSKDLGKNTFCFFTPEMNNSVTRRMQLELELRRAVAHQEFCLHYQPVLDVGQNQIVGVEALVRWQHPEKGLIYPDNFIDCAEDTGLIVELGSQVLKQAAVDLTAIRSLGYDIHMAVNVSGRQCTSSQMPIAKELAHVLKEFKIAPKDFHIEITESMLMENSQQTKDTLQAIKDLGIKILMDDFGTGYSSLSYLKQFPIDILKIDRSFIWKMLDDKADANLVEAIVMIGKSLQLQLVGEGVESQEHLAYLANLGCQFAQGYHISKPIPLDSLLAFFAQQNVKTH